MAGKFIKLKKIVFPILTVIVMASQICGCAMVTSNELIELLRSGSDVEISMAFPAYDTTTIGIQQKQQDRVQLDRLNTYSEFRQEFDKTFNIRQIELTKGDSKLGCIYVNKSGVHEGNTVLMDSLRNKVWMETYFDNSQDKLAEITTLAYADVDGDDYASVLGALNAYYDLLYDSTNSDGSYFNANQSVERGEFYSLVYRATNGVNNLLKTQGNFTEAVGGQNDEHSIYASQIDQYAWINADNGGLRSENYYTSISRAEAVYMLVNMFFTDELNSIEINSIQLSDATNGGNYWEDTIEDKKISNALYDESSGSEVSSRDLVNGWQLGALSKMLSANNNNGDGVQTELFKALGVAYNLDIIESETRWNEPVSKSEAIDMLVRVGAALNERDGYLTEIEDGDYDMFTKEQQTVKVEVNPEEVFEGQVDDNGNAIQVEEISDIEDDSSTSEEISEPEASEPEVSQPETSNPATSQPPATSKPSTFPGFSGGTTTKPPTGQVGGGTTGGEAGDSGFH